MVPGTGAAGGRLGAEGPARRCDGGGTGRAGWCQRSWPVV